MDKNIKHMLRAMTAEELAAACSHEQSSLRNIFTEELCRRAGLSWRYRTAYEDKAAREVVDRAARSFGVLVA